MANGFDKKHLQALFILVAVVIFGVFLVFRQIMAVQSKKVELEIARVKDAPEEVPLEMEKEEETKEILMINREVEPDDLLEEYERESRKPNLLQIFRMGETIAQKNVEGVEYVSSISFRRQVGTGRILADVLLNNISSSQVRPRFQVMLFNQKGRFLVRDTVLYITEELNPGEKKTETLSLRHGPAGVSFFEIRELD